MGSARSAHGSRPRSQWACALDLAAEPAVHHGWEENAATVLVASDDPRLNALLNTRFRHTREHGQLDLFIDSAQSAAVNALVDALTARHAGEEIFGPVMSVFTWSDHEDVLARANALPYGLTAAIVTNDLDKAMETADRVEARYVWITSTGCHSDLVTGLYPRTIRRAHLTARSGEVFRISISRLS